MYFWLSFMRKPTRSAGGPVPGREPRDCDRDDESRILLAIVDNVVAEGIVVGDRRGNLIYCNQKWIDFWQIPARLLKDGKLSSIWEFTAGYFVDPDNYLQRIRGIEQTPVEQRDLLELRDGRRIERIFTPRLTHGPAVFGLWSFRSAAERQPSDVDARRLAAIVDNSDDAIIGKDLNGIISSWNAGAERIFGYSADEMIGTPIRRLIPAERQAEEDMILDRIRRGMRVDHFETRRLTKSGTEIHASITVSPIKDPSGKVIGASKIARDITERKLAEEAIQAARAIAEKANAERDRVLARERAAREEAERANRAKDEFLATLSHELRTPLNAILGWASLLRDARTESDLDRGLDVIERNARAQAQIIDDLLDMSRIISGKVRLDVQSVDLIVLLRESVETVRAAAEARAIDLRTEFGAPNAFFNGDANRLRQVFWNLLNNAIKFTPAGGCVCLKLEESKSQFKIQVMDTGEGIAPEFLPSVFNRFQQADASTTRRHGGLGLGLALVKQLVELHGGHVSAQSPGLGKGATFVVNLPFADLYRNEREPGSKPIAVPMPEPRPLPDISLKNVHALIVEDEPDAAGLIKALLETNGATVCLASSAEEGLAELISQPINVLICDIGMPEEDGYSLIKKVRELPEYTKSSVAAVAVTAYARLEDRTRAFRSGFQNHLSKPVEPAELLAVVHSLAHLRASQDA
jgi:PAS domain S-box-containing protein